MPARRQKVSRAQGPAPKAKKNAKKSAKSENGSDDQECCDEVTRSYKLSAGQGDADGQFHYGVCLEEGRGVRQNYQEKKHATSNFPPTRAIWKHKIDMDFV